MTNDFRDISYWLGSTEYEPSPGLQGEIDADVVIAGGGFTGLSSAYYLKESYPELKIALLEANVIGYGGSGRNGGFAMPLLGWDISYLLWAFKQRGIRAHHFMLDCVRRTRELVEKEQLDCDLEYNGLLVLARNKQQMRQLEHDLQAYRSAGCDDVELLEGSSFTERLNSAWHVGALYEPDTAIINPAKMARELKRILTSRGVTVYEHSIVTKIEPGETVRLETEHGTVAAKRAVLALDSYGLPLHVRPNRLLPVHTYIILTEPLSDKLYAEIGWTRREGIEDKRQLVHYMRLTADNRVLLGGRDVAYYFGNKTYNKESNKEIHEALHDDLVGMFPMLKDTRITHRWGGPVAVTPLMVPTFGYHQGHRNIAYGMGYCGHGVALSLSAGMITRDLLMNPETEYLKELLFVNNDPWAWPPEPIRYPMAASVRGAMRFYDRWVERNARGARP